MSTQSLYQILDIPDYSDITLVKKSFRQLALKYHPDRNKETSASEKFKTIVKVYEILNNPILKQNYDFRLKNGFDKTEIQLTLEESASDKFKKEYAQKRKHQKEIQEVENITKYEKSLGVIPFIWRIVIIGLVLLTGILNMLNDWYQTGNKIALGIILFIISSLFLWNELYKYFWHKSVIKDEEKYSKQAYTIFITVFFVGIFTTFSLIKIKKVWQLQNFGKVIYASVDNERGKCYYTYNNENYFINIYNVQKELKNKEQILIRISIKEPEIWEYVDEK